MLLRPHDPMGSTPGIYQIVVNIGRSKDFCDHKTPGVIYGVVLDTPRGV
jgi:hypothetical protein